MQDTHTEDVLTYSTGVKRKIWKDMEISAVNYRNWKVYMQTVFSWKMSVKLEHLQSDQEKTPKR